jgi:hypothetical protein
MEEVDDVNFPPPGAHKTRSIEWLVSNAGVLSPFLPLETQSCPLPCTSAHLHWLPLTLPHPRPPSPSTSPSEQASGRNSWLGATGEKLTGGGAGAGGGGGGGAASSSIISGLSSTHGGSSGAAGGGGGGGRRRSVAPIDGGGRARRLSTIHISTGHDISTGSSPKHARSRRGSSVHWADGTAGVEGGAGGAEFAEPPSSPMRKAKRVVDMFSSYKAIRGSQSAAKKTLLRSVPTIQSFRRETNRNAPTWIGWNEHLNAKTSLEAAQKWLTAGIPPFVPCFGRAVNKISQQKWDKDASTVAFYSSCKYCASELLRVQVRKWN